MLLRVYPFRIVELNNEFHFPFVYPNDNPPFRFGSDWNDSVNGFPNSLVYARLSPLPLIRYLYVDGNVEGNSVDWTNLKSF